MIKKEAFPLPRLPRLKQIHLRIEIKSNQFTDLPLPQSIKLFIFYSICLCGQQWHLLHDG
jgi:hypothetical protein